MPGHIGTSIVANSRKIQAGTDSDELGADEIAQARARISAAGIDTSQLTDVAVAALSADVARRFLEDAPMTAAAAAKVILDGVKTEQWRILVGDDAHEIDSWVRRDPERAYEPQFFADFAQQVGWKVGG
jgi:transcriptional regulator of nitric oxide reductase